jgi:hypothetical protein
LKRTGEAPFFADFRPSRSLARALLNGEQIQRRLLMYTATFFSTKLGRAALASVAAMLAMNCIALTQQLQAQPALHASAAAITGELA